MSKYSRLVDTAAMVLTRCPPQKSAAKDRATIRIDDTKGKPAPPAPCALTWMIVTVAPNGEAKAAQALTEAGYLAWHPQVTKVLRFPARRLERKVFRPLFSRYLFVAGQGRKSMMDCHVQRILTQRPSPALVHELSARQCEGEFDISKPVPPVEIGTQATITHGPFVGLTGLVTKSDAERVTIIMDIMGSMQGVAMPASHLKSA